MRCQSVTLMVGAFTYESFDGNLLIAYRSTIKRNRGYNGLTLNLVVMTMVLLSRI